MSLPYDIARCAGVDERLCAACRRTEPGHPSMQVHVVAAFANGQCHNFIEPDRKFTVEVLDAILAKRKEQG